MYNSLIPLDFLTLQMFFFCLSKTQKCKIMQNYFKQLLSLGNLTTSLQISISIWSKEYTAKLDTNQYFPWQDIFLVLPYVLRKHFNTYPIVTTQETFTCSKSINKTLKRSSICSKSTIKTPEQRHWSRLEWSTEFLWHLKGRHLS